MCLYENHGCWQMHANNKTTKNFFSMNIISYIITMQIYQFKYYVKHFVDGIKAIRKISPVGLLLISAE